MNDENRPVPYGADDRMLARIERDFTFHPVQVDRRQGERYEAIRNACKALALLICDLTPSGREQSVALTNIEQVSFYANAAIARGEV